MLSEFKQLIVVAIAVCMTGWLAFGGSSAQMSDTHGVDALAGTGSLTVSVQNTTGGRVVGANVILFDSGGSIASQTTTGFSGKAVFPSVAAGSYTIFASKVEFFFGFPIGMFGTGSATVVEGGAAATVVVLDRFTY